MRLKDSVEAFGETSVSVWLGAIAVDRTLDGVAERLAELQGDGENVVVLCDHTSRQAHKKEKKTTKEQRENENN